MTYNKEDAQMTKGVGILCMVILHLFCRTDSAVFGTPLLWLNKSKPLVYLFGFFAEICVPLYSMCAGYAIYLMYENNRTSFKERWNRIIKLLINYWIILVMFSLISILYTGGNSIPGSIGRFVKNIFLLDSYNGAWWYLHSYVFIMMIPVGILMCIVKKFNLINGIIVCLALEVTGYLIRRFGLISIQMDSAVISYVITEIENILRILPSVWIGGYFCKYKMIGKISDKFTKAVYKKESRVAICLIILGIVFTAYNVLHKAVLVLPVAIVVFVLFNICEKGEISRKIFMSLGKHSTNIWLTHMFFYTYIFDGLVQSFRYPLFMLVGLLLICIMCSYVIMFINNFIRKWVNETAI